MQFNSHIIQVFRNQASNQKQEVQVILLTSTKKVHQSGPPYMGMTPIQSDLLNLYSPNSSFSLIC